MSDEGFDVHTASGHHLQGSGVAAQSRVTHTHMEVTKQLQCEQCEQCAASIPKLQLLASLSVLRCD